MAPAEADKAEADAPTESAKTVNERDDRVAANDDVKTNIGCDKSSMISNLQAQTPIVATEETNAPKDTHATKETNATQETTALHPNAPAVNETESTEQPIAQDFEASLPQANPPLPQQIDDGWDPKWDDTYQAWFFVNRFTGVSQWQNPRVPETQDPASSVALQQNVPQQEVLPHTEWVQPESSNSNAVSSSSPKPASAAGRYNPAIHGSWDPNADYAREVRAAEEEQETQSDPAPLPPTPYAGLSNPYIAPPTHSTTFYNKVTGQFETSNENRHSNVAKDKRQMEAFFNVDVAANSHEGRSLKAERRSQKVSKKQIQAWNERAQKKKWEKKTAWLKD